MKKVFDAYLRTARPTFASIHYEEAHSLEELCISRAPHTILFAFFRVSTIRTIRDRSEFINYPAETRLSGASASDRRLLILLFIIAPAYCANLFLLFLIARSLFCKIPEDFSRNLSQHARFSRYPYIEM